MLFAVIIPEGGLWVAEARSRAEVESLVKFDPFYIAGLRQSLDVFHWSKANTSRTVLLGNSVFLNWSRCRRFCPFRIEKNSKSHLIPDRVSNERQPRVRSAASPTQLADGQYLNDAIVEKTCLVEHQQIQRVRQAHVTECRHDADARIV